MPIPTTAPVASFGFVFVVAIIVVPIPATAPVASLGFVFVATSVALYAGFEFGDSLLPMFARDASGRMFVAPITGVLIECVSMARLALAGGVVAIEAEVLFFFFFCRAPCLGSMTAPAIVAGLAMKAITPG